MYTEPSFTEIQQQRREAVLESIRPVSVETLEAAISVLFPDVLHPWYETFGTFVRKHRDEQAYRGETGDGYGFVYYPKSHRGVWFHVEEGVRGIGYLSERNLDALAGILRKKAS